MLSTILLGARQDVDCEECKYCHEWAGRAVRIDRSWHERISATYEDLLDEIDGGTFWDPYLVTMTEAARRLVG